MNKIVMIVVFLVVTGGMLFVCANSHIDFFPCEITREESEPPRIVKVDGTCSLLGVMRDKMPSNPEREEFTPVGWALLVAFCAGIGVAVGAAAGALTRKRR